MSSEPDRDERESLVESLRAYLLGVVMPLWVTAGFADYVLHRRSHIESTSGVDESILHAAGIALAAVPVLAGLFLEVNAGTIALMTVGFAGHLGLTIRDVDIASKARAISVTEQHVHAVLELAPFTALSFIVCMYREQALALIGRGSARACFALVPKVRALPRKPVASTIAAFTFFVAVPYAEELVRCYRHARGADGGGRR